MGDYRIVGAEIKPTIRIREVHCKKCGKAYTPHRGNWGMYCSRECRKNRIEKQCVGCGKLLSVKASKADKYNYCSLECKRDNRPTKECEVCKKTFYVTVSRKDKARYCSLECQYAQHRVTIQCAYCGQEKSLRKYRVDRENTRCCSNRCATLLRMRDGFEPGYFGSKKQSGYHTDIEALVEDALIVMGVSFIFEHRVHRYSVDFALPTLGIALECDGWQHRTERGVARDAVRDKVLSEEGWIVIHLQDKDIREDPYSVVSHALKDYVHN